MDRCQKRANPEKLQQHFDKASAPRKTIFFSDRRDSIISAKDAKSYYTFKVPKRLLLLMTAKDKQEHYSVPLFVVNMTIAAVLELRNAIERLDKLGEPQVRKALFFAADPSNIPHSLTPSSVFEHR
jgi:hypothetical protein